MTQHDIYFLPTTNSTAGVFIGHLEGGPMSDESQRALGEFTGGSASDDRPADEAAAVAGNDDSQAAVVDIDEQQFPDVGESVEFVVTQVDYTVEGRGDDEFPIVHVFGRTDDNEPVHAEIYEFKPYFYAPASSVSPDRLRGYDRITGWEETDADGEPYESIRGERLVKIFGQTPRDVGQMRDDFDHYEADILFPNRLLIDKDITSGVRVPARESEDGSLTVHHSEIEAVEASADPRVNTFDIEVDDRSGFPEDGEEPIICLTSHDSYDDEYIVWLYQSPAGVDGPDALAGYDPIGDDDLDVDVRVFEREEKMLLAFLEYIEETDPDVLTGWNFDDFDAPYLLDRIEKLRSSDNHKLNIDRLSRVDEVWRSDWQGPDIKGRVVFDLLYAYKRTQFTELESYRLDAVGEQELGVGKERYAGDIGDLWEDDPERLLEYNLRDVELCVELDREQDIVDFWDEVRTFVGCKLEDATTPGDAVDMYVLHKLHGEFALPSKGRQDSEDYEGGAVFDPITGVRENVTVLDLKSLYPMCMVTTNASPETKVDPESYDGETYRAPNGTHFRKEPDGVIREMVDELLTEREEKKERRNSFDPDNPEYERLDRQQAAVKVIMNSLYGVLGWDRFRLYDKEMGAAVTATGRDVIDYTDEVVANEGYEVVYGDSVTGDRPIVVRDPDGDVRIQPIEELFAHARERSVERVPLASDGGTSNESGTPKDRVPLSGWDALSVNDEAETEWRPITQVIRHETEKDVVTLQHKFGESTTTRDHSYVVEESGDLVERPPEAVEEPLRVDGLPDVGTIEAVDVYEVMDGYTRTYDDGRMVGAENAVEKTKRVHADDEWVWFGHEHHCDVDKYPKVKRHIDLAGEDGRALVRLLAAYVTEGSASTAETTDSRYGASICESRREWLEQLQADYHRLFTDTTASIVDSDTSAERTVEYETTDGTSTTAYDDRTKKLQMMNELAAVFFREFAGQRSRGKRLPSFVYRLPDDLQSLFLDVLVEGDGSREFPRYSDTYSERNFDFETTSRELAGGLSMLLTQRGEKHSLKYRDRKDSYTIRTCDYYRSGREPVVTETDHDGYVYDLSVEANENFVDAVGGIVLHNTDSVMLQLGDISAEDVDSDVEITDAMREKHPEMDESELETIAATIQKGFELEEAINASYDDFASDRLNADDHRFQIEFEKLYRRFFQAGKKKRYAGHIVWKEGKDVDDIDITGFEYQRSDIAPITKRVQKEVIDRIVHGDDAESIKEYVGEVIEDYQAGNVDLDDVGIPGGIGKKLDNYDTDTAQVRGAKYANLLLGTNFQSGSKPKRLYLKRVHSDFFERVEAEQGLDPAQDPLYGEFRRDPDVICFEYADQVPEEFEIDWDKMLDKTLKGPIARILEALDISWDEVKSGQEQTGLGQFM
jgi:DNA polymerase I